MKLHKWITLKHPVICQSLLLLVYLWHSKYCHSKYCHQMLLENWTEQNFGFCTCEHLSCPQITVWYFFFCIRITYFGFLTIQWRTSKCILIWDCPTYLYSSIIHLMEHIPVDTTEGSNYLCLLSRLKAQKSVLELLDPTWLDLTWLDKDPI